MKMLEQGGAYRAPFDRARAAQAISEQLVMLSVDPQIAAFPEVTVVWN